MFGRMSVHENLEMGAFSRSDKAAVAADFERVYGLFPRLKERETQKAGTLSGGEQQMLAIGRALMAKPQVLLLDEPSMGLAPILVEQIFDIIKTINEQGTTVLLVEQNALMALAIANRGYILQTGEIVLTDDAAALARTKPCGRPISARTDRPARLLHDGSAPRVRGDPGLPARPAGRRPSCPRGHRSSSWRSLAIAHRQALGRVLGPTIVATSPTSRRQRGRAIDPAGRDGPPGRLSNLMTRRPSAGHAVTPRWRSGRLRYFYKFGLSGPLAIDSTATGPAGSGPPEAPPASPPPGAAQIIDVGAADLLDGARPQHTSPEPDSRRPVVAVPDHGAAGPRALRELPRAVARQHVPCRRPALAKRCGSERRRQLGAGCVSADLLVDPGSRFAGSGCSCREALAGHAPTSPTTPEPALGAGDAWPPTT